MIFLTDIYDLSYYAFLLGYFGIFLYFISLDQVTPVPHEISLLSIGFLCSKGAFHPVWAGMVSLAAFVSIDLAYFFLIRLGNQWAERMRKRMDHSFLQKTTLRLQRNFPIAMLFLCFIPRMRFWSPILSSVLQVPLSRFLKYDLMSLVLFTSLYISLGFFFHRSLNTVLTEMEVLQNILFGLMMILMTFLVIRWLRKWKHVQ